MRLKTALYISGGAHAGLVVWALVAGWLSDDFDDAVQVTEVSLISGAEFAALVEQAGSGTPSLGAGEDELAPEPEPAPEPDPEPEPVAEAEPEPVPEPEPALAPEPDLAEVQEPEPVVPTEAEAAELAPEPGDVPEPADRVAPEPVQPQETDVAAAPLVQEAAEPDPAEEAPAEAEPQEAAAPDAATTRILTEATETGGAEIAALAPATAPRPPSRPARPVAAETVAAVPEEPQPEEETADPLEAAIAGAVAEAATGGGAPDGDPGPPMTAGERDALRLAVQQCWVVDVGSESANVTVTVGLSMSPEGRVVNNEVRMLAGSGGSDSAIQAAYDAARRAILRCQREGYDLPEEKYAQWQEIEMVFNPSEMRIR